MNKKILAIITTTVLTIGAVTVVYAKENNNSNKVALDKYMMYQDNVNKNNSEMYSPIVGVMRNNNLAAASKAMENRNFDEMDNFMRNITEEQYNQMTDIMKNNGYEGMAKMMESISRQDMVNMHNSMMRR